MAGELATVRKRIETLFCQTTFQYCKNSQYSGCLRVHRPKVTDWKRRWIERPYCKFTFDSSIPSWIFRYSSIENVWKLTVPQKLLYVISDLYLFQDFHPTSHAKEKAETAA